MVNQSPAGVRHAREREGRVPVQLGDTYSTSANKNSPHQAHRQRCRLGARPRKESCRISWLYCKMISLQASNRHVKVSRTGDDEEGLALRCLVPRKGDNHTIFPVQHGLLKVFYSFELSSCHRTPDTHRASPTAHQATTKEQVTNRTDLID